MFGLFGNKEIKTCAKDVVEITKIVHQIMSKLPNKKIDKNHITKQLGSHRIGVIDDHYGRGEISIPTSLAATSINSRTECCLPVEIVKSSGLSCCNINHCIST